MAVSMREIHAGSGASVARRSPLRLTAAVVAILQLCTACFTYVPPRTAPAPGAPMLFELTDEGRVTHSARLGPGILRVSGALKNMEGDRYVVDVSNVTPIRGLELPVSGIRVTLGPEDINDVRVRTLSRKRTAWLVGSALAVVVTFLLTEGFKAGSTPPEGPPDGGGPDNYRGAAAVRCCD